MTMKEQRPDLLTQNEGIRLVAVYGYTAEKIQQGHELYIAAAVNTQNVAAGAQRQATLQARAAEQSARANYQALAQVARAVLMRDMAARDAWVGRLRAARHGSMLARYGYDSERLAREPAALVAFGQAD
jgi:hypothetical protein